MPRVDVVLFDADGVIQHPSDGWRELLASCAGTDDPELQDRFVDEVFVAEHPTQTGAVDFPDALSEVLRRWRSDASVDDALRPWTMIDIDAAVVEVVRSLRSAGVECYLATNQHAFRAALMRQLGYGEWFDGQFYSCELGLAKPDPAYFAAILERLGVAPERVLFIDDRADNVVGARQAGLLGEVFTSTSGVAGLHRLLDGHGLSTS
ncbi:MAG TPA: HAD family phosphatase [Jiangellaceae bacterium]